MKEFSIVLCVTFYCLTAYTSAEITDDLVKSNLKQIINNALDALVSLQDESVDINAQAAELTSHATENRDAVENENVNMLGNEIKELEKLLLDEKKEKEERKREEFIDASATNENEKKQDLTSEDVLLYNRMAREDAKRETKSREEKATVEVNNDNLKELVDLVVRTLDEEAKKETTKRKLDTESKVRNQKREIVESKAEKKELKADKKNKEVTKKEVKEEAKKEVKLEKKELCNSRKKECLKKKSADEKKTEAKKSLNESVKKETKNGSEKDDKEERDIVERILEGKNEDVREAFASLLGNVFEKADGLKEDSKVNEKKEIK